MPYKSRKITSIDTSGDPKKLTSSVIDLAKHCEDEFAQVASSLQDIMQLQVSFVAPTKPRTGMVVYADGTHWNPGSGEGVYTFGSDSAWHYLEVPAFTPLNPSPIKASLTADVLLNNIANYFDGPSVAQGSVGTWFASGKVTVSDSVGPTSFFFKLWDGTTVVDSGYVTQTANANYGMLVAMSGIFVNPTGNIRISVRDVNLTTGKILFNASGNSKDSTITAYRIA